MLSKIAFMIKSFNGAIHISTSQKFKIDISKVYALNHILDIHKGSFICVGVHCTAVNDKQSTDNR